MQTKENNTEHFNANVPEAIRAKLAQVAEAIYDDISDMVTSFARNGMLGCPDLNVIYGKHVSGFIPFQCGGFTVSELCQNDQDSSYHFTQKQSDFANEQATDCFKSFLADHSLTSVTQWDDMPDDVKEAFSDYENEWMEPASLSFEMFADGWQEPHLYRHIIMRVAINYKDAPYYREKYAEHIKSVTLDPQEFLSIDVSAILDMLKV